MERIVVDVPDEVLISLKETSEEFAREIRMLAAAKLYQLGRLSSGRAAQLAGMPKVSFLHALHRYNVPVFDMSKEELERDIDNA